MMGRGDTMRWVGYYDLNEHHDGLDGFQRRTMHMRTLSFLDDNM